jgi:hypothetical protein
VVNGTEEDAIFLLTHFNLGLDGRVHRRRGKSAQVGRLVREAMKLPTPAPDSCYTVTATNGRTFNVEVPKGSDVFRECRNRHIEIQSFIKEKGN